MYNFLVKNGQLLAFGVGLLITIIFFVGAAGGDSPDRFNFGLGVAIALAVLCGILMIIFGLYQIATNPKGSMKGIITFGGLLVLFGILYATSKPETSANTVRIMEEFNVTEGVSKFISGGILTTLLLIAATVVAFAFSEVRNFFK